MRDKTHKEIGVDYFLIKINDTLNFRIIMINFAR